MDINFDYFIDRTKTNDLKWNKQVVKSYLNCEVGEGMIPMWVADTDFKTAPVVIEALKERVDHGVFGYCAPSGDFYSAISWWLRKRFNFDVKNEWIIESPTVVASINIAIRSFSNPGDGIIIQSPVYDPFETIISNAGRTVVNNALVWEEEHYQMDFELLEKQASMPENKMLILCSPHNPVGRVWSKDELNQLAKICMKHGIIVVSDEIHSDIIYSGYKYYPLLSLNKVYQDHFIHLSSPGKAFNIAGLKIGYAIVPNKEMREKFSKTQVELSLDIKNTFGIEGLIAAYTTSGERWLQEKISYLESNLAFTENFINEKVSKVKLIKPEGTFLCWLDFSEVGLSDRELSRRIIQEASVVCVPGPWFGSGGKLHMRLNIGCTKEILGNAL